MLSMKTSTPRFSVICAALRAVAPIMKERGWGRIINISGLASRSSGSAVGSIRNVSVSALTKNLADELGPFGINAVVIHPGATRTEATPGVAAARAEAAGVSVEEILEEMANANSVRKLIDARQIAYVAAFVASPKAVAINGDAIAAGGGVGNGNPLLSFFANPLLLLQR